jgi:mRNA-degrading endonuclease RelE of RelBE toxin-antitoxin system
VFTFVETPLFTRLLPDYLSYDEFRALQAALSSNPGAGSVIPGSGGVRKLRWSMSGRGKRGGLRIIYYLRIGREEIWLLTLYPKNVTDNIPAHVLKKIREEIEDVE